MLTNNLKKFSEAFPGKFKVSKNKKGPAISVDDFYQGLYQMRIRKGINQESVLNLSRFLDRDKMCRLISEEKLGDYIDAKINGNPYIASFGTRRRKLPDVV